MNLANYCLTRILLAGFCCLCLNLLFGIYECRRQQFAALQHIAAAVHTHLQFQLVQVNSGYLPRAQFPDFSLWKQTSQTEGVCISYTADAQAQPRQLCSGGPSALEYPRWFELAYQQLFGDGMQLSQDLNYNRQAYGQINASLDSAFAMQQTWRAAAGQTRSAALILGVVSLLTYILLRRQMLGGQQFILATQKLAAGDLSHRIHDIPPLWNAAAAALNQLAAAQQQLQQERQALLGKLMQTQEQELRNLARELHDEFGQYLTAIHAIAAALPLCPESELLAQTLQELQQSLQQLLNRLRPAELEELGLSAGLRRLIAIWRRACPQTRYELKIKGDEQRLTPEQTIALYRIAQEALSNAARHAAAENIELGLDIGQTAASLRINDDGQACALPTGGGLGLIGMRERAAAAGGKLQLNLNAPHGLVVRAEIPLTDHD